MSKTTIGNLKLGHYYTLDKGAFVTQDIYDNFVLHNVNKPLKLISKIVMSDGQTLFRFMQAGDPYPFNFGSDLFVRDAVFYEIINNKGGRTRRTRKRKTSRK